MKLNRFHKIVLAALIAAQNFLAVAQTTNTLAPSGYAKFIADRNIFDPTRVPNVPSHRPPPRPVPTEPRQPDSFSLVGIIGYGEGRLAGVHVFFDGSSSQYQKEAQLNGTIANFKVAGISADSVTLVSGTNTMVLEIGEQLHDDTNGDWFLANGTTVRYNANGGNRYGNNGYGYGRNSNGGGFAAAAAITTAAMAVTITATTDTAIITMAMAAISTGAETTIIITMILLRRHQTIPRPKTRMHRLPTARSFPFKITRWLPTIRTTRMTRHPKTTINDHENNHQTHFGGGPGRRNP